MSDFDRDSYHEFVHHHLTCGCEVAMVAACNFIDRQNSPASPVHVNPAANPAPPAPVVEEPHFKQYIFIRKDLGCIGFSAAQVAHAAGESAVKFGLPEHTWVAVIAVPSEGALRDIARKLTERGIEHVLIEEPDEPWCGQATAIGVKATKDHMSIRKVSSHLPRYK